MWLLPSTQLVQILMFIIVLPLDSYMFRHVLQPSSGFLTKEKRELYILFTLCYKLQLCLTLNLLTTTIVAPPSNASKWQMGFNSAFKGMHEKPTNTPIIHSVY